MSFRAFKEIGQPSSHKRKQAYKIGMHIGAGEFGEVKLAESTETGELVAIKVVPKSNYGSTVAQAKRLNEYGILNHPNVLGLKEWFESRERYYFVLQYMAGGELYDIVESRGHLPEPEARCLAKQMVEALEYLHGNRIVHRDLKLENLLTDESHQHVVVADMGLAVHLESDNQKLHARCGSLGYTAPEVYAPQREGYSTPVDMWSLGVIIFLMLGGRFPFVGATPVEVAEEGMARRIRFTNASPWTEVSEAAKDLIRRLLEPDQLTRITAKEALEHPWMTMQFETPAFDPEKASNQFIEYSPSTSTTSSSRTGTVVGSSSKTRQNTQDSDELQLRRTVTQRENDTYRTPV